MYRGGGISHTNHWSINTLLSVTSVIVLHSLQPSSVPLSPTVACILSLCININNVSWRVRVQSHPSLRLARHLTAMFNQIEMEEKVLPCLSLKWKGSKIERDCTLTNIYLYPVWGPTLVLPIRNNTEVKVGERKLSSILCWLLSIHGGYECLKLLIIITDLNILLLDYLSMAQWCPFISTTVIIPCSRSPTHKCKQTEVEYLALHFFAPRDVIGWERQVGVCSAVPGAWRNHVMSQ